jgi:hypothetical protein
MTVTIDDATTDTDLLQVLARREAALLHESEGGASYADWLASLTAPQRTSVQIYERAVRLALAALRRTPIAIQESAARTPATAAGPVVAPDAGPEPAPGK